MRRRVWRRSPCLPSTRRVDPERPRGLLVAGDVPAPTAAESGCSDSRLEGRSTPDEIRSLLRALLELELERVLVSHGEPALEGGRAAAGARGLGR